MKTSETAKLFLAKDNFLLLTHKNPDGDTLGSASALCSALRRAGKTAYLFPNIEITKKYKVSGVVYRRCGYRDGKAVSAGL